MAAKAKLELVGFKKLKNILDPKKFERRAKKHIGQATLKNGLIAEGKIKEGINKGKVPGKGKTNADLTIAIKGSDRPLVDSGELVKSINSEVQSWKLVFIGVNRNRTVTDENGKKRGILTIAQTLHDGAEVKVTAKMRRFFFWMAFDKESPFRGVVKPLKATTKKIIIPPRPFLHLALTDRLVKRYTNNWNKAVRKVMQGKN
jgi:hypothetical protein